MPYAEVNDIRMYYEEAGSGIPLVLLHGATGAIDFHASSWGGLMPGFAERYRAIHLEHRGHGRTVNPAGRLSYGQIADDVCAFIDQLGLAPGTRRRCQRRRDHRPHDRNDAPRAGANPGVCGRKLPQR